MVNFTFVSHNGARPEKSELVKSHVMRESQKRRREAKQRHRSVSPLYEASPTRSTATRTEGITQNEVDQQLPSQTGASLASESPQTHSSPTFSISSGFREHLVPLRLPQSTTLDRSQLLESISQQKLGPDKEAELSPDQGDNGRRHGHNSALTRSDTTSPPLQRHTESSDTSWISKTWFNRVHEIVSHYFVSFRGTAPDPRSTLTHWFKQPSRSPIILLSYSLLYCAHRDLILGIVGNDDHYFKARTLQLINAALENNSTALNGDTIMAILAMSMYENLRGSDLVTTHSQGLRQMFDMRGGIENFMSEKGFYIGNFALLGDMTNSCCSNKTPLLFEIELPVLRDTAVTAQKSYFPHSPLRVVSHRDARATVPIPELRSSLDILRDAFDFFEIICNEVVNSRATANEASQIRYRQEKSWARLQTHSKFATDPIPPSTQDKVEEAIKIAGKIHFNAVVSRVQHEDALNTVCVKRLHVVLQTLRLDFWTAAPYLYLWVLLTGGAACARLPEHRAYFVSEMGRVGITVGFYDWVPFTQVIRNFLWLQEFLRKNNKRQPTVWQT